MAVVVVLYLLWPKTGPVVAPPRGGVTIVDSFYPATPKFTDDAVSYLKLQGVKVNVYTGKNVTVDFYKKLPSYSSSILVLRVHSGTRNITGTPTYLFTTELYNPTDHWYEQFSQLVMAGKTFSGDPNEKPVFTVAPQFISMCEGTFQDTIVILSSCYGLSTLDLASEFIRKGAKAFISWDERVSLFHTDKATTLLLRLLIENKMTVGEAVANVMNSIGPDPDYKSELRYYPAAAGAARVNL